MFNRNHIIIFSDLFIKKGANFFMKLRKVIGLMLLLTASLSGLSSCSNTGPQGEQGIQGETGPQGPQGENGKDGSSLLTGNEKPDSNLGKNGDSYIDLDTWNYYIKTNAGWILQGNIKADSKDYDGTEGLEFYPINDTECAVAVGKAKLLKEIIIPSKYKNYTVTTIYGVGDEGGFRNCSVLEKITLPDTIASIGSSAFSLCSGLTSITLPNSLTSIESNVFFRCSSLTSIAIPNSVTSIGDNAFAHCSSLSSITIPENVTSIGKWTFLNCSNLTSIIIPESVTSIGDSSFWGCSSLKIYCEASSEPSGWDIDWNYSDRPVYWAGEWEYDADGNPTTII